MTYSYPSVIVVDLDYTIWPCWCDTHINPPIKSTSKSEVVDRYGTKLSFYKDVENILEELVLNGVKVVAASRTATPRVAQELLSKLHVNGRPAIKYFDSLQWGQGSKKKHITKAARDLGLQKDLEKGHFILFDDEYRNRDVEEINCHFFQVDEASGLNRNAFQNGLQLWTNKIKIDQLTTQN